jgi:hypothetical protein
MDALIQETSEYFIMSNFYTVPDELWAQFSALQSTDRKRFELLRSEMRKKIPTKDHAARLEYDLICSRIRSALLLKQEKIREIFKFDGYLTRQMKFSENLEKENFLLPIVIKTP